MRCTTTSRTNYRFSVLVFVVKPLANHDLWIIADYQNHDKIQEFTALKNAATRSPELSAMHIIYNYDSYCQPSNDMGNCLQQILNSLSALLSKQKRLPHTVLICMGDQLLKDRQLMKDLSQVNRVLTTLSKKIVQNISDWYAALPPKAKPERLPRIYITKPLPIPIRFYQTRLEQFDNLVHQRKKYIAELVKAVKVAKVGFINSNLTQDDGELFERITTRYPKFEEKFILNPKGLRQYWSNVSQNLYNLAWDAAAQIHNRSDDVNQNVMHSKPPIRDTNNSKVFARLGPHIKAGRNFNKFGRKHHFNNHARRYYND